jgi:hypothetical protein
LTDIHGREIDGAIDGQAGSEYLGTIIGNRVTVGGIASVRSQGQPPKIGPVVDYLLRRGELAELKVKQ